jgi:enoyl-CoA hydratase/carnithine racemase
MIAVSTDPQGPAEPVLLTADVGRVRVLTFNRPHQANSFNAALYLAAATALRDAAADEGVGAVVLTGSGKSFSAGTDLNEMAAMVTGTGSGAPDAATPPAAGTTSGVPFNTFLDALVGFPKPLLAAVNGAGVGLGLTMLAHCDIVLIADSARLYSPFTAMGVAPEAASSYLLPRRMGRQRASALLLESAWISAAEAVEAGLALRACPAAEVLAETVALATAIASRPLASVMATKKLIVDAERAGIDRARKAEGEAFAGLLANPRMDDAILGHLQASRGGNDRGRTQ